jgi:uncharacterized SAM-binding protein YcdF (DUF218 family)
MNSRPAVKRRVLLRWRRLLLLFLLLPIPLVILAGKPLLRLAARIWVVSDTVGQADLIVVLGGQIATRPARAAELYRAGVAPAVFIMREDHQPLLHGPGDRAASVASILEAAGVPAEAMLFSEAEVGSTRDEAFAFRKWLDRQPTMTRPRRVILVTDAFHSRRARASFRREAPGIDFRVITVPHRKYDLETWWESSHGIDDFRREFLKNAFERLRPLIGLELDRKTRAYAPK